MHRTEWTTIEERLKIETPFITFFVEQLEDDLGTAHEWARIDKPDSLLLVIEDDDAILLPPPAYRPGIKEWTLDLPGGRLEGPGGIHGAAQRIAARELGLEQDQLNDIAVLSATGWPIDSSTSSARLHVVRATLAPGVQPADDVRRQPSDADSISALITELCCLQCRAALEAWRQQR